jgi:hypothetical protein
MYDLSEKASRNPFVNQVSSFRVAEDNNGRVYYSGRNPFVNQVSSFYEAVLNEGPGGPLGS